MTWTLPDLVFRAPDCPFCDTETNDYGNGPQCDKCGISWNDDGTGGQPDDETAQQCEAIDGRFLPGGRAHNAATAENWAATYHDQESIYSHAAANRCHRPTGHSLGHIDRTGNWFDDSQRATPEQIKAAR